MKIDRRNPEHLRALAVSAAYSSAGVVLRPFIKRKNDSTRRIIFYGHTLNGNLKAFYDFLLQQQDYEPYFLALDVHYYKRLRDSSNNPETILNALSFKDMMTVAKADAFITSHGIHLFSPFRALTDMKFIDVWHGVSYKGFGKNDFKHLHAHDETWVSSEFNKKLYISRYGFKPEKVKVTGYGRTDVLVSGKLNKRSIIEKYDIPKADKYILIAPTWAQDVSGRSLVPFGEDEVEFFKGIDEIASKNSAHIIFRTHINSGDAIKVPNLSSTSFMPYSKYEVVEDFLFIADILVTDWSSIGIDYLPLKRPTIFLDVPAPFKHGFNLGPEHRFGDVAGNYQELLGYLDKNLKAPDTFIKNHKKDMERTINSAFGPNLDGKSTERYFKILQRLLSSN